MLRHLLVSSLVLTATSAGCAGPAGPAMAPVRGSPSAGPRPAADLRPHLQVPGPAAISTYR